MSFQPEPLNRRGGYAPRRGRGGLPRPFVKRQESVKLDITKNPLGELLIQIKSSDLTSLPANLPVPTTITDCHYVTSYNWLAGKDSAVLVPGQPPRWSPLKTPQRLSEDSGDFYRDLNAARYPEYPIAPAVKAIMATASDVPAEADVFACGSTLGNLLRFVRGVEKAFRFCVEVVGNTVFLIRKENDPKELIKGVRGFGHSFPDAYTTWPADVKGSETHQRIVQYDLGGIQCLVRFECDGFFDDEVSPRVSPSTRPPSVSTDTLTQALSSTTISTQRLSGTDSLSIEQAGKPIPQASIFDLKTRSGRYGKPIKMDDITPQLWVKQVPNFIIAYHDGSGLFRDIQIQDVRTLTANFERDNADAIRKLVVLLHKIIAIAKADSSSLLEVHCPGHGVLEIRKQSGIGVHALPSLLREQWVERCGDGSVDLKDEENTGHGVAARFSSSEEYENSGDYDEEKDFTACSVEECGYCGRCTY